MNVKCFESGEDFGGTWYWNRYPLDTIRARL